MTCQIRPARSQEARPSRRRRRPPNASSSARADRGPRGVGQVELDAVGEPVVADRVDGRPGRPRTLERPAGLAEQVAVDRRQGEQRRPGVEAEAVAGEPAELAADVAGLLADGDLVAERGQPRGGGETAHARTDDDDLGHGRGV